MKNKIKKIATALLAFTVGCVSLTGCNVRQDTIRFGAAGVGGGYYAFATAYTQLANAEDAEMKFNIKSTAAVRGICRRGNCAGRSCHSRVLWNG